MLRRRAGGFPAAGAAGFVGGQDAEGGQAVEHFFDVGFVRALEGGGDFGLGPLGSALGNKVAHGRDLLGQLLGPGGRGGGYGRGGLGLVGGGEIFLGRGLGSGWVLKLGAQPADEPAPLSVRLLSGTKRTDYLVWSGTLSPGQSCPNAVRPRSSITLVTAAAAASGFRISSLNRLFLA